MKKDEYERDVKSYKRAQHQSTMILTFLTTSVGEEVGLSEGDSVGLEVVGYNERNMC